MGGAKRKTLSISEKVLIIRELENGCSNYTLSKRYELPSSTISTIWRNRQNILDAFENNQVNCKKLRKCNQSDINEALINWCNLQRTAGLPVNGPMLKKQAEKFARQMGYQDYHCRSSWIDRFKKRYNITFTKHKSKLSLIKNEDVVANEMPLDCNVVSADVSIKVESVQQVWVPKQEEESDTECESVSSKYSSVVTVEQACEALNTLSQFANMQRPSSSAMLKLISEMRSIMDTKLSNYCISTIVIKDPLK
ncbi:hypothetical protein AMK59_1505 [Oryctes borbonicus]|uniref:HTH CENPB-type domain-containing protein n=1 Tax=Oryctes borbonicus TaxID=1629725 RepID=A0A0T6BHT8_9SCAR|nr:hypothetical protein AMK59_1505 [Oryctes borbonicus]